MRGHVLHVDAHPSPLGRGLRRSLRRRRELAALLRGWRSPARCDRIASRYTGASGSATAGDPRSLDERRHGFHCLINHARERGQTRHECQLAQADAATRAGLDELHHLANLLWSVDNARSRAAGGASPRPRMNSELDMGASGFRSSWRAWRGTSLLRSAAAIARGAARFPRAHARALRDGAATARGRPRWRRHQRGGITICATVWTAVASCRPGAPPACELAPIMASPRCASRHVRLPRGGDDVAGGRDPRSRRNRIVDSSSASLACASRRNSRSDAVATCRSPGAPPPLEVCAMRETTSYRAGGIRHRR